MDSSRFFSYILAFFLLIPPVLCPAQNTALGNGIAERLLTETSLQRSVEFLADTVCGGRATATKGAVEASFWLARRFDRLALLPAASRRGPASYVRSFRVEGRTGHNVIGICLLRKGMPSSRLTMTISVYLRTACIRVLIPMPPEWP